MLYILVCYVAPVYLAPSFLSAFDRMAFSHIKKGQVGYLYEWIGMYIPWQGHQVYVVEFTGAYIFSLTVANRMINVIAG